MRHLKVLGVALIAMFAFGLTATSAFATLPDLSIALGGAYPVHLQFNDVEKTGTRLNTTAGNKLSGKGLLVLLLSTALSALGTFEALFLKVKNGTTACEQEGEKNKEEVLTSGEFHLVYPTLSPLTLGIAFLLHLILIKCGAVKIHIEGCVVGKITHPEKASEDVELATGLLEGDKKGKNTITEYENEAGEKVKGILLANFGTGFLQAEEAVEEPVHLETLEKKMFTISPI
jgi:hypothetical protein